MARKDKYMMPQSTAGLIRYFEESKEAIKIKPQHLAGILGVIILAEMLLAIIF